MHNRYFEIHTNCKAICVFDINNNHIYDFDSITSCINYMNKNHNVKLSPACITNVCKGKYKQHRGFIFRYKDSSKIKAS